MVDRSTRQAAALVPEAVAYVRDLLAGFDAAWFLCGGWAVDAWLGRQTRHHGDVDIAIFHHDQRAIIKHFPGWALVGHDPNVPDDTTEPWDGRHLDLPAHVHVPELGSSLSTAPTLTHPAFEFEFLLNEGSDQHWVLNRQPQIAAPLERCARLPCWDLPVAAPEIILFYKAGGDRTPSEVEARGDTFRPRDEQDFFALLPTLTGAQRSWLRASLATVQPEHPWLADIASAASVAHRP
jgi:hypothetical protein